jgi:thioester reductase-like protein
MYEMAKRTAVEGARGALILAAAHHRKPIHYVSCIGTLTDDLFSSKEGWAVGEVVHKIAPDTDLSGLRGACKGGGRGVHACVHD